MMPLDFLSIAQRCAPQIDPTTMAAIVRTESGFNPYAIGVVHGRLRRQPLSAAEAVATARALEETGWNFSVGLAQVNRENWPAYGMTPENAFEPCRNLAAGAAILHRCFSAAAKASAFRVLTDHQSDVQAALRAGLSCYASGNFSTGYRTGYVQHVVENAATLKSSVPEIVPIPVLPIGSVPPIRSSRSRSLIQQPSRRDYDGVNAVSPAADPEREPEASAVVF
ncbi:lytic transglycosylase [Burkholderia cepacia]|uniref:lytic transglycosylase domain-containing protein n=1 Tax=Burkholderia cepacia TaxID=292 RepID=UPI0007525747|nr:lytic transglycosylase domain-containing protein [Burkholderia cepacia]KVA30542.1 lytic transglycosylase [Burkholderia cepacia]KVA42166.1 lytic transglycosylase [Burkholderia cepacia]